MQFLMLGPLEVWDGGRRVELGRPKQRAVLAVLLIEANRVVAFDRLIDLLWGDEAPVQASGAVHVYLTGLRRALEPDRAPRSPAQVLITRPPGYLLAVDPDAIDAHRFEMLAADGRRLLAQGRPAEARAALTAGLALWRGPALQEFAGLSVARTEASRLEELWAVATEDRIDADLALGQHAEVIGELEQLVAEHPLRERLWGQLMVALYRAERQSDALRAYTRARVLLCDELGIEPGPGLRRLETDILHHAAHLDWRPPSHTEPAPPPPARAAAPAGPDRSVGGRRLALVGRAGELEMLDGLVSRARGGRGGVVLVSGEPGIGKTRLVEEVAARAAAGGADVVWGQCHEGDGAPPFWPWVQVVRRLLHSRGVDDLREALAGAGEVAQIVPELRPLAPGQTAPFVFAASARFHLAQAVAALVTRLAADRPLAVVLEDVHWADIGSLELLQAVAEAAAEAAVLLVVTYRDVDPAIDARLASTLGALAPLPAVHRVDLAGLTPDEVGAFIVEATGVEPSPVVTAAVHTRTDGNPFFVAELTRLLAAEGRLAGTLGRGRPIPTGVRDVIRRRLSRLSPATTHVLGLAAVLGRDVDVRVLAAASGTDEDEVLELLDLAVAVGILVEEPHRPDLPYKFAHALVQETVYAELRVAQRPRLHARAATALRQVHGDDEAHAVEVAHHLFAAAPVVGPDGACAAALRAAEVAQRRLAFEQAESLLQRALALVETMPDGRDRSLRELGIQHRLAALLSNTEGYHAASVADAWERARQLARDLGDTSETLESLWGLARVSRTRGEYELSMQFGRQLLELADDDGRQVFALAGHETCGLASFFTGRLPDAPGHLARAIELSDALGIEKRDGVLVLHPGIACRAYLGNALWLLGVDGEPDELLAQAVRMADDRSNPLDQAIARLYAYKLACMRGRPDEGRPFAEGLRRLAETTTIGALASVGTVLEGWIAAHEGAFDVADARFTAALAALRTSGWRIAWTFFMALRADACRLAGQLEPALAAVAEGLETADVTGEDYYRPELYRLHGELRAALGGGAPGEAEASLRRAVALAARQGSARFERRAQASLDRLRGEGKPPQRQSDTADVR